MLAELALVPPLSAAVSEEVGARLPEIAGGLAVAIAHLLRLFDTK